MKNKFWPVIGVLSAAAAVLIMAVILVTGLVIGVKPPAAPGVAPIADQYNLGAQGYFVQVALHPSDKLVSPLVVKGQARLWYFEGSFPVELKDGNGQTLATGAAQAQGDWMSDSMVPFSVTLNFAKPTTPTGMLILKKDNPSGLPQNDDQVQLAVNFDLNSASWASAPCRVSGCSSQLCSDQDLISTCIYKPEFACYKTAVCARQADGQCGWTPSPELSACLAGAK